MMQNQGMTAMGQSHGTACLHHRDGHHLGHRYRLGGDATRLAGRPFRRGRTVPVAVRPSRIAVRRGEAFQRGTAPKAPYSRRQALQPDCPVGHRGHLDSTERHFLEMLEADEWLPLLASHDSGSTTGLMAGYFGIPARRTITVSTACSSAANALIVGANMIKTT